MTDKTALFFRQCIDKMLTKNQTDEEALEVYALYKEWTPLPYSGNENAEGEKLQYHIGDIVRYNDTLYKVVNNHNAHQPYTPDITPSLYARVLSGQNGTRIGEWEQPDSTNPYMLGDKVIHNNQTWESTCDNNVWEPGVYGWSVISEEE